jgi:hypothetical protein
MFHHGLIAAAGLTVSFFAGHDFIVAECRSTIRVALQALFYPPITHMTCKRNAAE